MMPASLTKDGGDSKNPLGVPDRYQSLGAINRCQLIQEARSKVASSKHLPSRGGVHYTQGGLVQRQAYGNHDSNRVSGVSHHANRYLDHPVQSNIHLSGRVLFGDNNQLNILQSVIGCHSPESNPNHTS